MPADPTAHLPMTQEGPTPTSLPPWQRALRRALVQRQVRVGLVLLGTITVLSLLAPGLAPHDPYRVDPGLDLNPPSAQHWLGTDGDGADIFSRLLYGGRVSLQVALGAVGLQLSLGVSLGLVMGWFGGWLDRGLLLVTELLQAFPGMLVPLLLSAFVLERGAGMVVLALTVSGWIGYARVTRGEVRRMRGLEYILAAEATGIPTLQILWKHLLPGILPVLLVQASFGLGHAVLAEAGLSFLGLGVAPETPSWGNMLAQGRHYLLVAPQLSIYPGMSIALLVMGFQLVGDGLSAALDPRQSLASGSSR